MSIEGRVSIDVALGDPPRVNVAFAQPGNVTRLLKGKTPAEALAIIPAVFALCGKAQVHAARLALDAAEGRAGDHNMLAALQCLTEMESLRENSLRIAREWTQALVEPPKSASLKQLMRFVPDLEAALGLERGRVEKAELIRIDRATAFRVIDRAEAWLGAEVFGEPVPSWRKRRGFEGILVWAALERTSAARLAHRIHSDGHAAAGAVVVHGLATLESNAVLAWLAGAGSEASLLADARNGSVPETTALSRHAGDPRLGGTAEPDERAGGLLARLIARLIELSELPERMRRLLEERREPTRGRLLEEGCGMSDVSAARGTLIHAASVADGRIREYRVLPPTRWNFDARGAAARAIESIAAAHGSQAHRLCELMVTAIDPCVAYSVRVQ